MPPTDQPFGHPLSTAPSQHATGEISDIAEAILDEELPNTSASSPASTEQESRFSRIQLTHTNGNITHRDVHCLRQSALGDLIGLADIDQLNTATKQCVILNDGVFLHGHSRTPYWVDLAEANGSSTLRATANNSISERSERQDTGFLARKYPRGYPLWVRFPEEIDHDVIVRLRRIEGQVRGLQRLVDEGADCSKIVTQLSATKGALDRVGFKMVAAGMQHCLTDNNVAERDAKVAELEKLFLKLT